MRITVLYVFFNSFLQFTQACLYSPIFQCHYDTCLEFFKEISYWIQIPSLLTSGNWVELIPVLISTICYKFPPKTKSRLIEPCSRQD